MTQSFWFWAGVIVLYRIVVIIFADGDLGPDEAQYWHWAQDFDFGYFSKPPMIAWVIAASTGVFGDAEWAVRLPAPLLHAGAAAFIYLTTARLFDQRAAFYAGLAWLTLPGVGVSSLLITTDAPLLFFVSASLYLFFSIATSNRPQTHDYALLGMTIGLGLLSKYAMTYFVGAAIIILFASKEMRQNFMKPQAALIAFMAMAIFAPNLIWNAANDFQTVAHTAANANWASSLFKPVALAKFLSEQFAVFGPVLFAALLWIGWTGAAKRTALTSAQFSLLVFALTPLIIIAIQAFVSRAHANWAAAAYPAAVILVTGMLMAHGRALAVRGSLALHAVITLLIGAALTNFPILDRVGLSSAVAELRGWESLSADIVRAAEETGPYDAVLLDDRSMIAAIMYYERDAAIEFAALDPNNGVDHHYEAFSPFRPADHERALLASILPTDDHVNYRFRDIRNVGAVTATIGPGDARSYTLFDISDYYGPPNIQYPE